MMRLAVTLENTEEEVRKKVNEHLSSQIQYWIDENTSITLKELKRKCIEELDIDVSKSTIANCIQGFNYSFKQLRMQPARRNDEKSLDERHSYGIKFLNLQAQYADNIVFIDETGFYSYVFMYLYYTGY